MSKKEILELLEEDVFTVHDIKTEYIDTNNGILNEGFLKRRKKILLENAISYLADELVQAKQEYPINDVSEVHLETDVVVMKRRDLDAILNYIKDHE